MNKKKVRKRVINIIIIAIGILCLLDFVPVKFTKTEDELQTENAYIFTYDPKAGGKALLNWITYVVAPSEVHILKANVIGDNPYEVLSNKEFDAIDLYNLPSAKLRVRFYGEVEWLGNESFDDYDMNIYADNWDIVYPINRLSIRGAYVPKNYLTIYDYNWLKVIKNWLYK